MQKEESNSNKLKDIVDLMLTLKKVLKLPQSLQALKDFLFNDILAKESGDFKNIL